MKRTRRTPSTRGVAERSGYARVLKNSLDDGVLASP